MSNSGSSSPFSVNNTNVPLVVAQMNQNNRNLLLRVKEELEKNKGFWEFGGRTGSAVIMPRPEPQNFRSFANYTLKDGSNLSVGATESGYVAVVASDPSGEKSYMIATDRNGNPLPATEGNLKFVLDEVSKTVGNNIRPSIEQQPQRTQPQPQPQRTQPQPQQKAPDTCPLTKQRECMRYIQGSISPVPSILAGLPLQFLTQGQQQESQQIQSRKESQQKEAGIELMG